MDAKSLWVRKSTFRCVIEAAEARLAPGIAHHTARYRGKQVIVGKKRAC